MPALPRRALLLACLLATAPAPAQAAAGPQNLTAEVGARDVVLAWDSAQLPAGLEDAVIVVRRDGRAVARLAPEATSWRDAAVWPGARLRYTVEATALREGFVMTTPRSNRASVRIPRYLVGAATADITPDGTVNTGGTGLGDGSLIPDAIVGRGGVGRAEGERIRARAVVYDDGWNTIAIASVETQGMFAAYEDGPYGLDDIARQVAADIPGLPAENILITSDHTHSGPDTIGAWGGVPEAYLRLIRERTIQAIEEAYADRRFADVRAGHSDASDLVYNQSCSEALNQSKEPAYPGPEVCATPGKDGMFRVVQATAPNGDVVATFTAFAAHATAGGGRGLHGDWPQFLSDRMAEVFGGTGVAVTGALGGTQPCRTACAHTNPDNPGYAVADRKTAYLLNYMRHVERALDTAEPVSGPVAGAKGFIREPVVGPAVQGLFLAGHYAGARLLRSTQNPWIVGPTVRTVVNTLRLGDVLIAGTPGEGFPAIGEGIRQAVPDAREVLQIGLANDQLGYLISPLRYVPIIAAEVPVNDNIIFNVSPTIGDHVMCADIRLAGQVGFWAESPAKCAGYDVADYSGDPVAEVPVGGVRLPG